jgi:hypothetical protein
MALIPMAIAFRLIYFLVSFLNERTVSLMQPVLADLFLRLRSIV